MGFKKLENWWHGGGELQKKIDANNVIFKNKFNKSMSNNIYKSVRPLTAGEFNPEQWTGWAIFKEIIFLHRQILYLV